MSEKNPIVIIIVAILAVSTAITLYIAETNALNSARLLDLTAFGNDLVTLVLIIVVLSFSAIGAKLIFGNTQSRNNRW